MINIGNSSRLRLLSKTERQYFNNNYNFKLHDNMLLVSKKDFNRVVAHSITSDFCINSPIRKIKISAEAIQMWKTYFEKSKYSVVDIQNAINILTMSYQKIGYEEVVSQLKIIDKNDEKF